MNFNKYHVSKNLLPSDSVRYEYAIRNGNEVIPFSGGAMYIVPIENGETYTVKIHTPNVSVSVIRLALYEQLAPSPDTTAYNTREILNTIEPTLTITNSKNKPYLIVQIAGAYVNDYGIDDVMLNTGSTALPYEPYSSEVWHDIPHYVHKTDTDIITTLPAVLYPNAVTATVGLKGNMSQSPQPSPTTPIQPSECGERTGNLWDGNYENGVLNTDGTLNAPNVNYNTTMYIPTEEKNYTLSVICNYDLGLRLLRVCFYDENKNFISYVNSPGFRGEDFFYKFNFTAPVNSKYLRFSYIFKVGMSDTNIMLNTGSTALPYEKFGYKIPISSANTTTPVYLGEVETTRRIKKLVLTGEEAWQTWNGNYYSSVIDRKGAIGTIFCTHFINSSQRGISYNNQSASGLKIASIAVPFVSDLSGLKEWLAAQYAAGTPVTIWYVLAEPETGIVNEPLRKIGDYADEVSGITIPTIAGANTITVDTTLQPSEVSVNYKGWHPVQSVHEAENGQWN